MILPAIDLMDGKCVRLRRGNFSARTQYDIRPERQVRAFLASGASQIHIIDLDGARAGRPRQLETIARLATETEALIQTGGGIRTRAHVDSLLQAGVQRVIVGSLAVTEPDRVQRWLADYGRDALTLALDIRIKNGVPVPALKGWQQESATTLWSVLESYLGHARHILVTDIGRDGMLGGLNCDLYTEITTRYPELRLQASGGVSLLSDIAEARASGAAGVIVGKALYENRFTLEEAIRCWQDA